MTEKRHNHKLCIWMACVVSVALFRTDGTLCGYSPQEQEANLVIFCESTVKTTLREVRNLVSIKQRALHKQIAVLWRCIKFEGMQEKGK